MQKSREDELTAAREACFAAIKRLGDVGDINIHGGVTITVDITAFTHVGFDTDEGRQIREKIYEAEMELMSAHPDVLFDFKVR